MTSSSLAGLDARISRLEARQEHAALELESARLKRTRLLQEVMNPTARKVAKTFPLHKFTLDSRGQLIKKFSGFKTPANDRVQMIVQDAMALKRKHGLSGLSSIMDIAKAMNGASAQEVYAEELPAKVVTELYRLVREREKREE